MMKFSMVQQKEMIEAGSGKFIGYIVDAEVNENQIDKKLENEMGLAYSIVKLGRSARNSSNMKNRQPLSKMLILLT